MELKILLKSYSRKRWNNICSCILAKAPDANFTKEQLWRALAAKVDVDGKLS